MLPSRDRIGAILFDLDGTLLDTAPDIAVAANRMLRALGREQLPESRIREFIGKGVAHLVRRLLELPGGDPARDSSDALRIFEEHYLADVATLSRAYPGVVAGLEAFRGSGLPMACVTNKPERFTIPLLAAKGLLPYFAVVVSGDTVAAKKPDPMPLLHAIKGLGCTPERTLVIGDSLNDVAAARAAGCPVAVVAYGYREGLAVEALGADAVLASIEEASGWITMGAQVPTLSHG